MKNLGYSDRLFVHVCNKSIANYKIFDSSELKNRFINALSYYNSVNRPVNNLGKALYINPRLRFEPLLTRLPSALVTIIAYCIMPDHYHILVGSPSSEALSSFVGIVENSYSRFFNTKYKRKGPLWQSRFRREAIENDAQLLHVSRYIHLNPTTSYLVGRPEEWWYSSYRAYIANESALRVIKELSMRSPVTYKRFVDDQIDYQRKLRFIKKHLF
jgi:putative transposase